MANYRLYIMNGFDNHVVYDISGDEMAVAAIEKARNLVDLLGGRVMLVDDYNQIIINHHVDFDEEE